MAPTPNPVAETAGWTAGLRQGVLKMEVPRKGHGFGLVQDGTVSDQLGVRLVYYCGARVGAVFTHSAPGAPGGLLRLTGGLLGNRNVPISRSYVKT